jgi:hypothetical protein
MNPIRLCGLRAISGFRFFHAPITANHISDTESSV